MLPRLLLLLPVSLAAVCCDYIGDINEDALWKLRENFCNNVKGAEGNKDEGYYLKTSVEADSLHRTEFAFAAQNVQDEFPSCWEATENLINQCARQGHAHGSWENDAEFYGMTLGDSRANGRRKRSLDELHPVTTPEDFRNLNSGTYTLDGEDVTIEFQDSVPSSGAGGDAITPSDGSASKDFKTTQGIAASWNQTFSTTIDLKSVIRDMISQEKKARRGLGVKRDIHQRCDTKSSEGNTRWVILQGGDWEKEPERVSGCLPGHEDYFKGSGKETCQTFSLDLSGALEKAIASVTLAFNAEWKTCVTQSTIQGCGWKQGACHVMWTQQKMYWQRGFAIETRYSGNFMNAAPHIQADVKFVHTDGPQDEVIVLCDRGCCDLGACTDIPSRAQLTWDECEKVPEDRRSWYATCTDRNSYNCHLE